MVTRAAGCLLSAEEDFEVNGKINSLGKKAQFPHPGKKSLPGASSTPSTNDFSEQVFSLSLRTLWP